MSFLKGSINLANVNLKPNKANKFIKSLYIPFALKAGTIGKLDIKISLLSMWSGPIDLYIEDLFLVLGPNLTVVSNDDSYEEDDVREPYDDANMYNIFEHALKLKRKSSKHNHTFPLTQNLLLDCWFVFP